MAFRGNTGAARIARTGLLTAAALILSYIEGLLPPLTAVPGIKIGIANAVSLFAIACMGAGEAAAVHFLRIILAGIFAGRAVSFIYSLAGGAVCFAVMMLLRRSFGGKRLWILSVFGALAHNAGQMAAAVFIVGRAEILWYMPALVIAAIIAGSATGLLVQMIISRLGKGKIV